MSSEATRRLFLMRKLHACSERSRGSTGTPACALFCGAGQTRPDPVGINRGRHPERAFLAPARLSHVGADFSPPALRQRLAPCAPVALTGKPVRLSSFSSPFAP